MRSALPTRIVAALVALLFFGGETGASGLDALLYHRAAPGAAARTHYEPRGGTDHHADQCLLALRLANGRASASLGVAIRFENIPSRAVATRPPAVPHRFYTGLHEQSRAPPAPLA